MDIAPGGAWVIVLFVGLLMLCVTALAAIPAYILWKMTHDKRYPLMWVTCSALIVAIAATQTFLQRPQLPAPTPINETLTDVADASGALRVTAIRLPAPVQGPAQLDVDVANAGTDELFLGLQYKVDACTLGNTASESRGGTHIWTVPPSFKGTLSTRIDLPTFGYGGKVTIVLARCTTSTTTDPAWLPKDSQAIYQNHFVMVAPPAGTPVSRDQAP